MRIHFTRLDLARTHLAAGADAMWELVNSLQLLQARYGHSVFGSWRRHVASDLRHKQLAGPVRTRLFPVAPHAAYFPDLLTPPEGTLGFEEGIETVLRTPRQRLRAELGRLSGTPGTGEWLTDLSAGRASALAQLGETLRAYHHTAVAPYWKWLHVGINSDLAMRRQAIRDGGVERLLGSFRPIMRWRHPVLEILDHPSDRDVHLGGRGLLLVPSHFCWQHPVTIFDDTLPQVVVYPVEHHADWLPSRPRQTNRPALARLLGHTRAAVLDATLCGSTTSELAHRLGVSVAAISHHTGILRDNGLVTSRRTANTVLHTISPLGAALLRQHA